MKTKLNTLITSLGVVLFTLWTTGCYTVNTYTKPEEARSKTIVVTTSDGKHYHFSSEKWSVDWEGNITGTGVSCKADPHEYHDEFQNAKIFSGTLEVTQISQIFAKEFDSSTTLQAIGAPTLFVLTVALIALLLQGAVERSRPF